MGGIALSAGIRQNLLSLQNTADMMSQTSSRLSTGKKVNSALDNPTSFFTAQGLSNRASDLSGLQDSMGLATQTLQAADKGIAAIQKLVDQAKSTVNQAKQVTGSATATTGEIASGDFAASKGFSDVTKAIITVGSASAVTVNITGTVDADAIATAVNSDSTLKAAGLTASVNSGKLSFSASSGEDLVVDLQDSTATVLTANLSETNGTTAAEDKTTKLGSYVTDYNNLRTQIDQLASDASFNGVNLLDGNSLTVKFNEDGSSKLDISGVSYNASGLGIDAATTTSIVSDTSSGDLANLKSATDKLRKQASTFGANLSVVQNRQDFTKNMINTLQVGSDNLTLADTNEEGANMLALQTRQSLSTTALSMASRADQAVLSFLR